MVLSTSEPPDILASDLRFIKLSETAPLPAKVPPPAIDIASALIVPSEIDRMVNESTTRSALSTSALTRLLVSRPLVLPTPSSSGVPPKKLRDTAILAPKVPPKEPPPAKADKLARL